MGYRSMADLSAMGLKAKLTSLAREERTGSVRIGVGSGLHLLVKPQQKPGTGAWVLRLTVGGKRSDMGLGSYPQIGLADARLAAADARGAAKKGSNPITERARARVVVTQNAVNSFRATANDLFLSKKAEWKNDKHGKQWMRTLEVHVFPKIGSKPVADIDTTDVLDVLQPIWSKIPETAARVRGRIEAVLNYASAIGTRPRVPNPAVWRGHLSEILGSSTKLKAAVRMAKGRPEHHPSLPFKQLPSFMDALSTKSGLGALALRVVILTAARSVEVRKMRWAEIDLEKAIWSIPPLHMKGGKPHFVPLSQEAIDTLEQVKALATGPNSLVFPGMKKETMLSDMTLSELVKGMSFDGLAEGEPPRWRDEEGNPVVPHGFRASFKAWSLANAFPDYLGEKALAHTDKDRVRAAYARDALIEERRPMMDAWADACFTR
jgi:integrase